MRQTPTIQTNNNGENKIRKILFNEVSFTMSIVSITIGVFLFITNPAAENQREIERLRADVESSQQVIEALNKIRDNDLHTLEQKLEASNERLNDIENQLIKLEAILNERLPTKP